MFSLTSAHRFFLCDQPTDMRKGFDSLSGLVRTAMKANPTDGSVYVFINKSRNLIKLLHWESDGFTLYYKRLEQGTFERINTPAHQGITWSQLMLITEGIKLHSVVRKKRYKSPENGA